MLCLHGNTDSHFMAHALYWLGGRACQFHNHCFILVFSKRGDGGYPPKENNENNVFMIYNQSQSDTLKVQSRLTHMNTDTRCCWATHVVLPAVAMVTLGCYFLSFIVIHVNRGICPILPVDLVLILFCSPV